VTFQERTKSDSLDNLSSGKRILLSTLSMREGNGGVCTVARMTAAALKRRHQVTAIACQDLEDYLVEDTAVKTYSDHRLRFALANAAEIARAMRVIYDHAGTARAHLDTPFWRRPYALWLHGWEIWERPPARYVRAVERASILLANSAYTVERGQRVTRGKHVVICPLGTQTDEDPNSVGPSLGPPTVMLLGRADDLFAKGHDLLIEIWPEVVATVPDARLVFVGGGSALERVRRLAAASSACNTIEIAGFVSKEHLESYWQRTTVFAMPGFAEGFGLVYIEAMRHGIPVIASTEDSGQEVNQHGVTGFNVARSDKSALTEAIVCLLSEHDTASRLGSAGHELWRAQYRRADFERRLLTLLDDFLKAA
jgi:phosphatidyl-myo-inositol dimannoside synthase